MTRTWAEIEADGRVVQDFFSPCADYTLVHLCQYGNGSYGAKYEQPSGRGLLGIGPTLDAAIQDGIAQITWFEAPHPWKVDQSTKNACGVKAPEFLIPTAVLRMEDPINPDEFRIKTGNST